MSFMLSEFIDQFVYWLKNPVIIVALIIVALAIALCICAKSITRAITKKSNIEPMNKTYISILIICVVLLAIAAMMIIFV